MIDFHVFAPHPDDDDSILLDAYANRLEADAITRHDQRQIGDMHRLGHMADPLSDLTDREVAVRTDLDARVSQVIRQCHAEVEARTSRNCPLPRPPKWAVGWGHKYYAADYPNASDLNAWSFWPVPDEKQDERELRDSQFWALAALRDELRAEGWGLPK